MADLGTDFPYNISRPPTRKCRVEKKKSSMISNKFCETKVRFVIYEIIQNRVLPGKKKVRKKVNGVRVHACQQLKARYSRYFILFHLESRFVFTVKISLKYSLVVDNSSRPENKKKSNFLLIRLTRIALVEIHDETR